MHIIYLTIYDLFHFISYKLLILCCLLIIVRKLERYVVENRDSSRENRLSLTGNNKTRMKKIL